ncbi:hypothetical protein B9479_004186 [Cryptococcus floricola]|uniref:Uncharacterized protein n=1 Tax=Cryptococcus floricola TaxID=2591691 RepID=A0A5D3AWM1_9TREE|nr:hypothetical protein B9479_004186 [Cryptococcus floricola]
MSTPGDNTQPTDVQSSATAATDRSTISTHATRITSAFMTSLREKIGPAMGLEDRTILDQTHDTIERDLDHAVTATLEAKISNMEAQGKTVGSMDEVKFVPAAIVPVSEGDVLMIGWLRGEDWLGNDTCFNVPLEPSG